MKKWILFGLILTSAAWANERCGVGTLIWGSGQTVISQYSEESSDSLSSDSLSITTGTSGCSNSGFVGITREERFFATMNFEELTREMAQGNGEVLSGFAQVLGCKGSLSGVFKSRMQSKYLQIYQSATTDADQMLINVKNQIHSDPALAQGCQSIVI